MAPRLAMLAACLVLLSAAPPALAQTDDAAIPVTDCIAFLICSWEKVLSFCPLIDSGPGYIGWTRGAYNNFDGTWTCFYSGIGQP